MREVVIGRCGNRNVSVDLTSLLRTRLLVQANSGGGKSWLLRRMAEQLFGKVPVWIVDPEGEFASLRERFGFVLVGKGGETPADPRSVELVANRLLEHHASVVFDLYDLKPDARHRYVRLLVEAMMNAPKSLWINLVLMLDEAHLFAPEKGQGQSEAYGSVVDIATRGRKRGFCLAAFTQRLSKITKNVTAELLNRLVGMTFEDLDVESAAAVLSVPKSDREAFKREIKLLEAGRFYGLGPAVSRDRLLLEVGKVETTHPEPGTTAAASPPPAPGKIKHLLPKLADLPKEAEEKARTEGELRVEVRSLRAKLQAAEKGAPTAPAVPTVRTKMVEVPALKGAQISGLQKAIKQLEKIQDSMGWASQRVEIAVTQLSSELARSTDQALKVRAATKAPEGPPGCPTGPRGHPGAAGVATKKTHQALAAPQRPSEDGGEPHKLMAGERRIIEVLAQFSPGSRTRSQIGALTGLTPSGGTFLNYFGRLRKLQLLKEQPDGSVVVTDGGLEALGGNIPPGPQTPEELVQMWRGKLMAGERKMLDALIAHYPESITREALGAEAGFTYTGGTFLNYLGTLRRNQLVSTEGDSLKAADVLFEFSAR
jgi:uncharacterized protein